MKKVFCITMFGKPLPWIQQYIDTVQGLGKYGWYWKIFTPNPLESKGNVEIIHMTVEEYNNLFEKKLGVKPTISIVNEGIPSTHITDFYIFSGVVFEHYLKDADYWGMTNLDVVYGRLDRFIPDSLLEECSVFSDDINTINGVFSLFKNIEPINHLYEWIENWKQIALQPPCKKCCVGQGKHSLYGSDEYIMSEIVRGISGFKFPSYYPMLSHDRLEQHFPIPKLEIKDDGSLWELFNDTDPIDGELARPVFGREIPYFHFSRTKRWPL